MKRIHDTTHLTEQFVKAGLLAAIAATMLLPTAINADGAEQAARTKGPLVLSGQPAYSLPLPAIPNLDAIPWLTLDRAPKAAQIGALLSPLPASLPSAPGALSRPPMWSDGLIAAAPRARNG
jgi:hypothetical protein